LRLFQVAAACRVAHTLLVDRVHDAVCPDEEASATTADDLDVANDALLQRLPMHLIALSNVAVSLHLSSEQLVCG
jgi:hypothetical protein